MRVLLAGGGTAGHVEPALAVADALRRHDPSVEITALGTDRGLETRLVPERGYDLELIPAVPLPRRPTIALGAVPTRLAGAVRAAASVIDRTRADVVVGFGGYVALPAYLAARRRHIPIVVHEGNARPGLANRVGARLTTFVAAATPDCPLRHATYVGIPLRTAVSTLNRAERRAESRREFGLAANLPTLLVFGGSQGARHINEVVAGAAPQLAAASVQVLHATGLALLDEVQTALGDIATGAPYVVLPYLNHMELGYAAADLALCRAGAMTCAELAAVGLPAIYVPLPHGNGEQRLNAQPVVTAGGGVLIEDAELTPERLLDVVLPLMSDSSRLAQMSDAAARFGRRDADELVADMVRRAAATRSRSGPV
ncbi:MAG: UDP-N-acetylglucosamine--N-acetylmuramyl-(pentapeptide) pyrophosphoryl-undecaprenol [Frankiales bacterium]|nr:UDP-N-acetylglucosamine--N-acetylmuramyl-(pentapeptide) pyrophosphoryl-undecaprenol [Frankiales bacterium]